jgi:hypothetical protein
VIDKVFVVASTCTGLLVLAAPAAVAAPSTASCTGRFFSEHAGLVPGSDFELSVGGFLAPTAGELRAGLGLDISTASRVPERSACDR